MTGSKTLLTFNKPTDNIAITGRKLRATSGEDLNIETSNNLIIIADNFELNATDLSAENLTIRASNYFVNDVSLADYINTQLKNDVSFNNVDISGNLRLTNANKTFTVLGSSILQNVSADTIDISSTLIIGDLSTNKGGTITADTNKIIINPHPNDNSGTVIIRGNLQVDGNQTTINSNVVDISDLNIRIASNISVAEQANHAGIIVGAPGAPGGDIASFKYNSVDLPEPRWETNIDLHIYGDLTYSGNVLSTTLDSCLPITYNTYALKNADLDDILISDSSGDQWITATNYNITKTLLSQHSYVKLEFKVAYICSQESEQYISFRVRRKTGAITILVFQDLSLGNAMGVTAKNIWNGMYIDVPGDLDPVYQLEFMISKGTDGTLDLSSGIYGKSANQTNLILLQELYKPQPGFIN